MATSKTRRTLTHWCELFRTKPKTGIFQKKCHLATKSKTVQTPKTPDPMVSSQCNNHHNSLTFSLICLITTSTILNPQIKASQTAPPQNTHLQHPNQDHHPNFPSFPSIHHNRTARPSTTHLRTQETKTMQVQLIQLIKDLQRYASL